MGSPPNCEIFPKGKLKGPNFPTWKKKKGTGEKNRKKLSPQNGEAKKLTGKKTISGDFPKKEPHTPEGNPEKNGGGSKKTRSRKKVAPGQPLKKRGLIWKGKP